MAIPASGALSKCTHSLSSTFGQKKKNILTFSEQMAHFLLKHTGFCVSLNGSKWQKLLHAKAINCSPKMIFDTLMYTFIRFTNACLSSIRTYWICTINLYPTFCFIHSQFFFYENEKNIDLYMRVDDRWKIGERSNLNQIWFIWRVDCDFELIIHILIACSKEAQCLDLLQF